MPCVALKLIANGESHALRSRERQPSSGPQDWAVKRVGVERREAYWSAAARDCGKARGKITVVRETMAHPACVLPECERDTMEESS